MSSITRPQAIAKPRGKVKQLWLAGILANLGSWAVTLLANRELTIAQMGDLGWYIQVLTLASIGSVSIGITTNRHTFASKQGASVASALRRKALVLGYACGAGYILLSPYWLSIFQLSFTPMAVLASAALFPIMFTLSWYRGRLQALENFETSAASLLVEACIKLLVPILWSGSSSSFTAFILAQPISAAAALVYISVKAKPYRLIDTAVSKQLPVPVVMFVRHIAAQRASLIVLLSADVLLAKAFLDPEQAGIYAILSLIGKMMYFAGQSIYTIVTPLLAPKISNEVRYKRSLLQIIVALLLMLMGMACLFVFYPEVSLVPLLTQARYHAIAGYRVTYSIVSSIFALSFVLSMHHNIKGRYYYSWVYACALLVLAITTAFRHGSIDDILLNVSLVAGMLVLVEVPRLRLL